MVGATAADIVVPVGTRRITVVQGTTTIVIDTNIIARNLVLMNTGIRLPATKSTKAVVAVPNTRAAVVATRRVVAAVAVVKRAVVVAVAIKNPAVQALS